MAIPDQKISEGAALPLARPTMMEKVNGFARHQPVAAALIFTPTAIGLYELGKAGVNKVREKLAEKSGDGARALVSGALKRLVP
jgi:hypothetical protein